MLTSESLKRIDREIAKYPADQKQSAVMAALAIAQEQLGWLSSEAIEAVANYLGMPPIAAYEVATFYNMYDLKPVGKYKVSVCTNLPCMLTGGVDAGEYLQKKLGIGYNETTPDGLITLKESECMGACGDAPVMIVNNRRMCSWMNPEQIDKLLAELK
ncbi:MAG: NADH-quinone oxidoreductase subunit NuoE [Candidatus Accumulibacter phosphatis]|jgi:NADH-quinone oxidoreductase subunit E|uniref:NADH-quinone oxidoreductase subunit NuoE n=1 Tax=Candidatus Accumulibacter contiguus TaxID=2954381 RepID=A0ABX1T8V8_9PROT|nr:NADH-quinone oxidoreductase subunit NuoE [Candidatus Accumulibacter contiguus]MBL8407056.1 NADH-quinone oxidoreductase subunit NuoE [Accumulibacter sp.]NMQ05421.1 NADH-quinone oxidoreductase subunit NuoE [Candidatus Accumulibacter contiguus]